MNRIAKRARIVVILILVLAIGLTSFALDYFKNADSWVHHPGSPHIYNAANIGCGIITDRTGALLVDLSGERTYSVSETIRKSTVHWVGDRKGNVQARLLAYYAKELAGFDPVSGVYAYGGVGGTATLTLSAELQMAALKAMGDYKGTVAIFNYKTGELLCAVTTPNFDPDSELILNSENEDAYAGVYVNRFLRGSYTPGSIFKIVTAAAALDKLPGIMERRFTCTGRLEFGVDSVTCERPHGEMSFREAFANSCNCTFGQISVDLGAETLEAYAKQLGLLDAVQFDGIQSGPCRLEVDGQAPVQVAWSGIGQHKDQINVCTFLTMVGAIANDGVVTNPYLVSKIKVGDKVTYQSQTVSGNRIMSSETASILKDFMRNNVENYYGEDVFHGFSACAKSGTAEVGGTQKPNAMFTGFVQDPDCPLAFIVAVEDGGYGKQICMPILSEIFTVIHEKIDVII